MIYKDSSYDNVHKNGMVYGLVYINNHKMILTKSIIVVVEYTQICVKINTKLTNFMKQSRMEWHNGE